MSNNFVKILNRMKIEGDNFSKLQSGMLVATFFSLWLAVYFGNAIEEVFGYILILSFGILHGANHINLLQVTSASRTSIPLCFAFRIYMLYLFWVWQPCFI